MTWCCIEQIIFSIYVNKSSCAIVTYMIIKIPYENISINTFIA
jgi:hypothetical protein